jgi:hypothetical protein
MYLSTLEKVSSANYHYLERYRTNLVESYSLAGIGLLSQSSLSSVIGRSRTRLPVAW